LRRPVVKMHIRVSRNLAMLLKVSLDVRRWYTQSAIYHYTCMYLYRYTYLYAVGVTLQTGLSLGV